MMNKKATDFQTHLNKQLKDKNLNELYSKYGKHIKTTSPETQTYKKLKKEVGLAKTKGEVIPWKEVKKQCKPKNKKK